MNRWEVFGLSFVVCLLLGAASAQEHPAPAQATQAKTGTGHGKQVFDMNCAMCHDAASAQALVGPGLKNLFKWPSHKLSDGTEHKQHTLEIVRTQVIKGGGSMAPMGGAVVGKDLDDLLTYLQTL